MLQSHDPAQVPAWQHTCVDSVRRWADARGYTYRFLDNTGLDGVPGWYRNKVGARLPIVADLARLLLIRDALDAGWPQALWLDADTLVFAPAALDVEPRVGATCAFGREYWLSSDGRRLRVHRNVHNAVCVFRQGCPVLPFLIHATERIIARVDAAHIAPQIVGPKLLGALHNIVGFELLEAVGAASPPVLAELAADDGPAVQRLRELHGGRLAALNLCASVNHGAAVARAVTRLLARGCL